MLIEQLLSVDVVGVGAGAEHVVVVGGQGDVYAWGRGQGGPSLTSLVVDVQVALVDLLWSLRWETWSWY